MRGRVFASLCLMVLASRPGVAQTPAGSDAPSKEQVLRVLDLIQVRARMVQMVDGMRSAMKTGAEAGLKQQLPGATPEQLTRIDPFTDAIFKDAQLTK
jgi:hypothetical protein